MIISNKFNVLTKNLKLILLNLNLLVSLFLVILSTFFFSYENLDIDKASITFEYFISLIGIFVYPLVLAIDADVNICDLIRSKKTSYTEILFIRFMIIFSIVSIIIACMGYYVKLNGGTLNEFELIAGTIVTSLTLGSISVIIYSFSNNIGISYLVSFIYYFIEFGSHGSVTKNLFLFSLTNGEYVFGKNILLIMSLIIVISSIYIFQKMKSL